uniref:Predicted pPIWI-associating nuclease group 2 domain-containing protein n=1 Tax=Rhodopseudomonas palustris (strain BisA53) TaxID=316055 RepID=Q07RC5_RHOP5
MNASESHHMDLAPIRDSEILNAIMEAVNNYDFASSGEWEELDQLSTHTKFESLDANPDGIFEVRKGNGDELSFQAIGDVYVTLNYGDKRDSASMSDSYPARFEGRFDRKTGKATLDLVKVDTSAFYS